LAIESDNIGFIPLKTTKKEAFMNRLPFLLSGNSEFSGLFLSTPSRTFLHTFGMPLVFFKTMVQQ